MEILGITLVNGTGDMILPRDKNSLITQCNLIFDPFMWTELFRGFWNTWSEGCSPGFYRVNGKTISRCIYTRTQYNREEEIRRWIKIIIDTQRPECREFNLDNLLDQVITVLYSES